MKTLVLYYSYTGHTRKLAEELAARENAALLELQTPRRVSKFKAYALGCPGALSGRAWEILPLEKNLEDYDRLILLSPVWAGNPPPPVNAALALLPAGKQIDVKMISGGGKIACRARVAHAIEARGSALAGFEDIKG
jgi:hypothetical protein